MSIHVDTYVNSQSNNVVVSLGDARVWFSYDTPIAFQTPTSFAIRENDWNNTTGKHLNAIDPDKSKRISGKDFKERYQKEVLDKISLGFSQ